LAAKCGENCLTVLVTFSLKVPAKLQKNTDYIDGKHFHNIILVLKIFKIFYKLSKGKY